MSNPKKAFSFEPLLTVKFIRNKTYIPVTCTLTVLAIILSLFVEKHEFCSVEIVQLHQRLIGIIEKLTQLAKERERIRFDSSVGEFFL